ncbi:polynucleotide adenylyltransferase [Puniceicoccaceae bacterium K14]|nr:polynucleotide adenylyltransferase [Puniceicoccaceae bacterium K14]
MQFSLTKRIPFEIQLPDSLQEAIGLLIQKGASCRLVGGCVRDALLERSPKDFDVEVYGLSLETISTALQALGKTDTVGKSFCVVKLWSRGDEYDFAIPRRESKTASGHRGFEIEGDATMSEQEAITRRDFTLNALLYDPSKKEVIDHCNGLQDLENKVLRHVSPAFAEDPLRVLRAMQFAARFDLTLHPDTAQLCQCMKPEYWSLAKERIWGEWQKWASQSLYPARGLEVLKDSGWLSFFPELYALVDLPQDPEWHPEGSVWIHTQKCTEALLKHTDWKELDSEARSILLLSVLCHDLGKARCTRFASKNGILRWISPGHDQVSGWLSGQFLQNIGAPLSIIEKVVPLVKSHHFLNTGNDNIPGDNGIRRLARRISPATINQLIYVLISDHLGRPPLTSEAQTKRIALFKERAEQLSIKVESPKPIILGRHLIKLGHKPGPGFKNVLDAAFEAQLDGAFHDEVGGITWLSNNLE